MKNIKLRIVKKEKDGVTISAGKGVEPIKISWDEFKRTYIVKNDIWAVPNDETMAKVKEADEHINKAVSAFIISGGLTGDIKNSEYTLILGQELSNIVDILGCSNIEAMLLVKERLDTVMSAKHYFPKKQKSQTPQVAQNPTEKGYSILADNPVLMELKKQMEDK